MTLALTGAALTALLRAPVAGRLAADYEAVFDDFVREAGGARITDLYAPPAGMANADYLLAFDGWELVLELKQMATYRPLQTLDAYFQTLLAQGRVRSFTRLDAGRVNIGPDDLSPQEWARFGKRFRPSVGTHLDKAARQLRDTNGFLPPPSKGVRRVFGAVLLNTNDFGVSTDLLHRLSAWKARQAWGLGRYRYLDFVSCLSMDLMEEDRHPLHGRHLARDAQDAEVGLAVWTLFDRWVRYGAAAVGAEVTFTPDATRDEIRPNDRVVGKIRMVDAPRASPNDGVANNP